MKRILMWAAILGGLVLLVVLLAQAGSKSNTSQATLNDTVQAEEHSKGNPDAPITLVEYSDFQCPACATTYPLLSQLAKDYPNDVRVVYRHFPLRQAHPQAQLAAQATEAAAMQGKFWEMHDMLFNTQRNWSGNPEAEDFFVQLAESLELDIEKFKEDLNSKEAKNAVNDDYASGARAHIPGTPSIFLNGQLIQNPRNYAGYQALITEAHSS